MYIDIFIHVYIYTYMYIHTYSGTPYDRNHQFVTRLSLINILYVHRVQYQFMYAYIQLAMEFAAVRYDMQYYCIFMYAYSGSPY